MRRRTTIAIALVVVAIGGSIVAWRLLRHEQRPRATTTSRLDVAAFRAELAERVRKAKLVIATRPAPSSAAPPRSKAWEKKGTGPMKAVKDLLLEPQCWVGPRELCAALQPLADACANGDARSCMAVGQYLADEPPRILVASLFFHAACRIGDDEGCMRLDTLEPGAPGTCEEDPFACEWRAYKSHDMAMHEQACSLGASESCVMVAFDEKDPDLRRGYYETACQLGHTGACDLLAKLLSPDCEDADGNICLPIDEDAAARAREIACAAGYDEQCT